MYIVCASSESLDSPFYNSSFCLNHALPFQTIQELSSACGPRGIFERSFKLTLQFDQTDSAEGRCQSIVSNAKQVGSVTRSGKEKFKLAITSNFQQPQQFQVGYKEYSRHTKRSVKVKAVVELQLCINLDTAEVSGIFSYFCALFTIPVMMDYWIEMRNG